MATPGIKTALLGLFATGDFAFFGMTLRLIPVGRKWTATPQRANGSP